MTAQRQTFERICLIYNKKSGQNANDRGAIERALEIFGSRAHHAEWDVTCDDIHDTVAAELARGADLIVAAGGDGTAMAVAGAMRGKGVPFAVLPLGTFNFFARGLGLSEDPGEAARQILDGTPHDIRVAEANGQVFLNNASLGIYPSILKERETVYARWGRRRIAAHWSVVKTFLRFQRPMKVTMTTDEGTQTRRTALIFVARSAYQLHHFGIKGEAAIADDRFAVLVARGSGRFALFHLAWRLARGSIREGRDYDLITTRKLDVEVSQRRALLAFDGEKRRDRSPFRFRMSETPLRIILPEPKETD